MFKCYMKSSGFIQCTLQITSVSSGLDLFKESPDYWSIIFIWGRKTREEFTLLFKRNWTLQHDNMLSENAEERQHLEKGDIWAATALISLAKWKKKRQCYLLDISFKFNWNGNMLRSTIFLSIFKYFHCRNLICACRLQQQESFLFLLGIKIRLQELAFPLTNAVAPSSYPLPYVDTGDYSPIAVTRPPFSLGSPWFPFFTLTKAPWLDHQGACSLAPPHLSLIPWCFAPQLGNDSEVLCPLVKFSTMLFHTFLKDQLGPCYHCFTLQWFYFAR